MENKINILLQLLNGDPLLDSTYTDKLISPSLHFPDSQLKLFERATETILNFDSDLFFHSTRTALLAAALGDLMSLDPQACFLSGLVHDVGKIYIDKAILIKPAPLSAEEYEIVKQHPVLGVKYLKELGITSESVLHAVKFHHRGYDNSGYPDVPYFRSNITDVVSIADVYDAMTHARVYSAPKTQAEALEELVANSNKQFNPNVVNRLLAEIKEPLLEAI